MRKNIKAIIIIPAIIGIFVSFFVFLKIWEKRKFDSYLKDAVAVSNVPLPKSNLTNSESDVDDYGETLKGKVLLVFLTTSCKACKKEVKTISQSMSVLDSKIKVYGISIEPKTSIKKYSIDNDLKFPVLIDVGGSLFSKLSVRYFPTKMLVEDGIIKKTWFGSSPDQESLLKELN